MENCFRLLNQEPTVCGVDSSKKTIAKKLYKEIVSRDFEGIQMIIMNKTSVPDVPLEVYYFFFFVFI